MQPNPLSESGRLRKKDLKMRSESNRNGPRQRSTDKFVIEHWLSSEGDRCIAEKADASGVLDRPVTPEFSKIPNNSAYDPSTGQKPIQREFGKRCGRNSVWHTGTLKRRYGVQTGSMLPTRWICPLEGRSRVQSNAE